ALFAFASTKIRYVAVDPGIGALEPHAAEEVLKNGFGDCKDKHILLTALLSAVGIRADAALIGVGVPFDADVPSPAQFNHVVTAVPDGTNATWLDATLEVAPPGFLFRGERD